ncbi:MFS multidrug transporter-like protein [Calycina marina]|uniref:MFS multidrug transporter-like protein n=1 Tax=Calycina marina TaxID=1763456 RepID=A0A9P7ZBL7_9HELO|nr:MFS multidrug transporter-like protein [Calycina marina]
MASSATNKSFTDVENRPETITDIETDEKTNPKPSSRSSGNGTDFIAPPKKLYLEFSTPLPVPSYSLIVPGRPTPPDLNKFISPFEWPESKKTYLLWVSCIATLVAAYAAGSYAPATARMSQEWGYNETAILVGITTFCTGFAIAPMVLAPFSEINGRYPVFVAAGLLYVVGQICCAVTMSYPGMLVARFFAGCGASVFSTMVGGVISDLYHAKERNTPMALFACGALFGSGLGPLCSGFVAQNLDWRWVFWVQTITCSVTIAVVALTFKETRGSLLLSQKATSLNKFYDELEEAGHFGVFIDGSKTPQRIRWLVKSDEERESITKMISISVYRPFHLLFTEPVVFFFSLYVSFAWAVLYLTFSSIPLVFSTTYNFTISQSGAVFAAMSIGSCISAVISINSPSILAKCLAHHTKPRNRILRSLDLSCPEARLYFTCIESILLPLGLFWFGFTLFPSISWIVPSLAIGCATMGIYSIYLATFNYLADTYHRHASSALAAQSFCRNILGGLFPLVTTPLFNGLGYRGATSLLGALALVLCAVPWVLVFYGPYIRARSKFASGQA